MSKSLSKPYLLSAYCLAHDYEARREHSRCMLTTVESCHFLFRPRKIFNWPISDSGSEKSLLGRPLIAIKLQNILCKRPKKKDLLPIHLLNGWQPTANRFRNIIRCKFDCERKMNVRLKIAFSLRVLLVFAVFSWNKSRMWRFEFYDRGHHFHWIKLLSQMYDNNTHIEQNKARKSTGFTKWKENIFYALTLSRTWL